MKKVDVHVHSKGSNRVVSQNVFTQKVGVLESYVEAEHQYCLAKRRGMDYVTISDHNSISEAKKLVELHPDDAFVSCEYEVSGRPEGQNADVVVLGVDDYSHNEFMRVREYGFKEFIKAVSDSKRPYTLAHPALRVKAKVPLSVPEIQEWVDMCTVIESINGDCQRENEVAEIIARYNGKARSGGSDDHAGLFTGLTYTVAPGADAKDAFLSSFASGNIYPEGEYTSVKKSQAMMIEIGRQFFSGERLRMKAEGFFSYFNSDSKRIVVLLSQFLAPAYLRIAGRRLKVAQERYSLALEKSYISYILSKKEEAIQDYVSDFESKLEERLSDIFSMVRPPNKYIPRLNFLEKIINFIVSKSENVKSDFDF